MQKNYVDPIHVRKNFSIFNHFKNKPLIYFDSASTAQVPDEVIAAINEYYTMYKANIGRGLYSIAEQATLAYENARTSVAQFIHAQSSEILFTAGTTDSINVVAASFAEQFKKGDEIIITDAEHHSNFIVWQQLAQRKHLILTILPVNHQGVLDPLMLQNKISNRTKLVSVFHVSNVTGGCNDVKYLTEIAHQAGAKILIDAAQSVAHQKIDIKNIGADFLAFSGHKLFGPTGIGILYVAHHVQSEMMLMRFGGGMVYSVGQTALIAKKFPHGFEAGTPHVAGVIGLAKAIDFITQKIDRVFFLKYQSKLVHRLIQGLAAIEHIQVISAQDANVPISLVTFYSKRYHAHDIAEYCNAFGIAVRAGNHCVQPWHEKHGINASVRVSFSVYNTEQEVDFLIEKLQKLSF